MVSGFFLLLIALLLLAPVLLSTSLARRTLSRKIGETLSAEVSIEDIDLGWWTGLEVTGISAKCEGTTFLSVDRISADPVLTSLLSTTPDLGKVEIQQARLTVIRDENGALNLDSLTLPKSDSSSEGGVKVKALLTQSAVTILDKQSGFELTLTETESKSTLNSSTGSFDLRGAIQVRKSGDSLDTSITGHLSASGDIKDNVPSFDGSFTLPSLSLSDVEALVPGLLDFPAANDKPEFQKAKKDGRFGGEIVFSGTLESIQGKADFSLMDFFPRKVKAGDARSETRRSITLTTQTEFFPGEQNLRVESLHLKTPFGNIRGSGSLSTQEIDFAISTDLSLTRATSLGRWFVPEGITAQGDLTSDIAIKGQLNDIFTLEGSLRSKNLTLVTVELPEGVIDESNLSAQFEATVSPELALSLTASDLSLEPFQGSGSFDLDTKNPSSNQRIRGTIEGDLDLRRLSPLARKWIPDGYTLLPSGSVTLSARAHGPADGGFGSILRQLEADVKAKGGALRFEEENALPSDGINIDEIDFGLAIENSTWTIQPFRARANGGSIRCDATLDLSEIRPRVSASATVERVKASREILPLLSYLGPIFPSATNNLARITGLLNADITLTTSGRSTRDLLSNLKGQGPLSMTDGALRGSRLLARVLELTGNAKVFPFEGIETDIRIDNQSVQQDNLRVLGEDLSLALQGVTTFAGALRFQASLGTVADRIRDKNEDNKWVRLLTRGTKIPVEIVGTIDDPEVKVSLPAIEETVQDVLQKGFDQLLKDQLDKLQKKQRKRKGN